MKVILFSVSFDVLREDLKKKTFLKFKFFLNKKEKLQMKKIFKRIG